MHRGFNPRLDLASSLTNPILSQLDSLSLHELLHMFTMPHYEHDYHDED